ncbi:MAG: hypothetical protein U0835_19515 [Isosphaeraceae bacterium]
MLDDGRREEAARLLEEVDRVADQFRGELRRPPLSGPRVLLQRAQALVNAGAMNEAVALSHQAYEQARDDPEVFNQMMKVHSEVGLALRTPESYPDAERILMCAYRHDQTDRGIHKALAERHYLHAAAMFAANQPERAREAAGKALFFDPKHPGSNALIEDLRAAGTTPAADGDGTGDGPGAAP